MYWTVLELISYISGEFKAVEKQNISKLIKKWNSINWEDNLEMKKHKNWSVVQRTFIDETQNIKH